MTFSLALPRKARFAAYHARRKTLRSSNNNHGKRPGTDGLIECNPGINHKNMTGFCIVFAFFTAGLITSTVIASKLIMVGPMLLPASVFI